MAHQEVAAPSPANDAPAPRKAIVATATADKTAFQNMIWLLVLIVVLLWIAGWDLRMLFRRALINFITNVPARYAAMSLGTATITKYLWSHGWDMISTRSGLAVIVYAISFMACRMTNRSLPLLVPVAFVVIALALQAFCNCCWSRRR
jgi:hypothetical protein